MSLVRLGLVGVRDRLVSNVRILGKLTTVNGVAGRGSYDTRTV